MTEPDWVDMDTVPEGFTVVDDSTDDTLSLKVFHGEVLVGSLTEEDPTTWIGYIIRADGTDGDDTTDSYETPEEAIQEICRRSA